MLMGEQISEAVGVEEINILDIHRHNRPLPKTVQWWSIGETREAAVWVLHKE